MEPQGNGVHTTNYNSELNPGISNEFAVAAFRFGHTLIPVSVGVVGRTSNCVRGPTRACRCGWV